MILSLLVEQQKTHFHALLVTRLTIRIETLQRLPSASVLLDSDPAERSDEAPSLSRCYHS
jgi:hypothetical protein